MPAWTRVGEEAILRYTLPHTLASMIDERSHE